MARILFVTSEAYPLIKTGGLGDVGGSLPEALQKIGEDVHLLMPAYRQVKERVDTTSVVSHLSLPGHDAPITLIRASFPDNAVPLWLVDAPSLFDRDGGPYGDPSGHDWPDNARRFTLFAHATTAIAMNRAGLTWQPDVVHCHDWQSGLVPALLSLETSRPATIFTIHNLAYQGLFDKDTFTQLQLPWRLWNIDGVEFHDRFSFIKGGIALADWVTTVSPTYAEEIRTPAYGYGLEGLLNSRSDRLIGILNGVDYTTWDPACDPLITRHYTAQRLAGKRRNKTVLRTTFRLRENSSPLFCLVSRLVEQKGIDLVIDVLPTLIKRGAQCVFLGSGEAHYEHALRTFAMRYPDQIGVHIGYDEALSHLLEAGADIFLMPSRFEPCGLNQIYSLRYGTLPIVRRTGGLADTVTDADPVACAAGHATGFVFDHANVDGLLWAVNRALDCYADQSAWKRIMRTAMAQEFSWQISAQRYSELYRAAITSASPSLGTTIGHIR